MTTFLRRALCAAAGALAFASAAQAGAAPFESLQPLAIGPVADARPSQESTSVALLANVDLGGKVDLVTAPADPASAHAFDGLFLAASSTGMPYASLASGGDFASVGTALSKNLRLSAGLQSVTPGASTFASDATTSLAHLAGASSPFAQRSADALVAGVSWDAAKWASFGLTASNIVERDGVLGTDAPGSNANTTALGLSARVRFGNGWSSTASYSEGISQLDLRAGVMPVLGNADSLHTRSYGIAIAKKGLFGDDTLGLAVSQPALGGSEFITMPGDNAATSDFFARNHLLDQVGHAQETDVEIGYVTSFLDGSLALQTNASFQMNYEGQNGQNAVSLLSRARIKF